MTGGASQAHKINTDLARVAQKFGLAFGVASQRAILRDRALAKTYQVRDVAPDPTVPILFLCRSGVRSAAGATALAWRCVDTR